MIMPRTTTFHSDATIEKKSSLLLRTCMQIKTFCQPATIVSERSFIFGGKMSQPCSDKRQAILESAEILIAEQGFGGLSMQKLATQAGVAAGTLYRYFEDKEHLLLQVRLHVSRRIADAVQANVSNAMSLRQRFHTMWLNIWQLASTDSKLICNHLQYQALPISTDGPMRTLEQSMFTEVDLLFDQGKQQGVFKSFDNSVLTALSFETTVTLAQRQALGVYQLNDNDLQAVIDACWDAIIQH